jgi:phage baseplate assembly protein gpV
MVRKILIRETRYSVPRVGKVLDNQDPNKKGRVLVAIPALRMITADQAQWCFIIDKRAHIVPTIGDYVIVSWIDGDKNFPIVIGQANEMKDMIPDAYAGTPTKNVLFQDSKKKIEISYDQDADELDIGKGTFAMAARKGDAIKSVTADDSTFWTTFIGGILTWLSTHTHVETGGTTAPSVLPTPSNPGSLTGKITAGSAQVKIGDKS